MMRMSTYGTNDQVGDEKLRTIDGVHITFKYPNTLDYLCQNGDAVDSHNTRFQESIVLEDTCSTRQWESCFSFLLGVSKVNDNWGGRHFGGVEDVRIMLEFRIIISRDPINNPHLR